MRRTTLYDHARFGFNMPISSQVSCFFSVSIQNKPIISALACLAPFSVSLAMSLKMLIPPFMRICAFWATEDWNECKNGWSITFLRKDTKEGMKWELTQDYYRSCASENWQFPFMGPSCKTRNGPSMPGIHLRVPMFLLEVIYHN